jgi:hypothetical protein
MRLLLSLRKLAVARLLPLWLGSLLLRRLHQQEQPKRWQ